MAAEKQQDGRLLRWIAVFKLLKAISLIAAGIGALHLLHHQEAIDSLNQWTFRLGFGPGARYVDRAIGKLANLPPKDFRELGIGSFVYAALFLTEATGLWLRKRWGEWVTTIITASLVPLEVFEIVHKPSVVKVVVLGLNVGIVVYLVMRLRKGRKP